MSSYKRETAALAAGSLVNGVLTYAFFAVTTHALGAEDAAPVSILWAYWSFAAAALTFPLQHWVSHSIAAHGGEGQVRAGIVRIAVVVMGATVATGVVSWLLRDPLFHRDGVSFPILVAAVTSGSAFIGVVRGALAARDRFTDLAAAVASEGTVRSLGAVALLLLDTGGATAFGIVLFAGQLVGLAWPTALRFSRGVERTPTGSPLAFLGGSAGGQLIGQTILVGGPVLLTLRGGSPADVTALFAGLALFRAPYTLALGVLPQLTGRLTTLVVDGRRAALRRVRVTIVALTVVSLPPVAVLAAWLGPWLIRWMFGASVRLDVLPTTLIALGSTVAMSNLVATITVMAQDRVGALLRAWITGAVAAAVCVLVIDVPRLEQTCWAFVAAEAVAFVVLVLEEARGTAGLVPADPDRRGEADGS
ncbi:MAG: lipopolysaccharide biosynthesis protein [Nocardioidaceae bacterium]